MPRDYSKALNGRSRPSYVAVPKWILLLAFSLLVLWSGWRIFSPSAWTIQRLDSPDGRIQARLTRVLHSSHHFVVEVRQGGGGWRTYYYSPALPKEFTADLGERLVWSSDSQRVFFRMDGRLVWGLDLVRGERVSEPDLQAATRSAAAGRL